MRFWETNSGINSFYPFGSVKKQTTNAGATGSRSWSVQVYRYGFNNQERETELGDYYSYEFRMLDVRIGKWFSLDKIVKNFESGYNFCLNNPIEFFDYLGLDPVKKWNWITRQFKPKYQCLANKLAAEKKVDEKDVNYEKTNKFTGQKYATVKVGESENNSEDNNPETMPSVDIKVQEFWEGGSKSSKILDKKISEIKDGRYVYTKLYGWVDRGHAFKGDGPYKLYESVKHPSVDVKKENGYYLVSYAQKSGIFSYKEDYWVKEGLTDDEIIQVTCAIFQNVSIGWENLQTYGRIAGNGSGFSPEDLPSNMLGLYRSIYYYTHSEEQIMKMIEPLTVDQSLEVYNMYPGTFFNIEYQNKTFNPIYFPNPYSPVNPVVPESLKTIVPAKEGTLFKRASFFIGGFPKG